ncbi:MAG: VTT domain-containing protein [Chloroflexi bacterium]|nr:VTT domain-containing protein [Chloroflexota bacterium]
MPSEGMIAQADETLTLAAPAPEQSEPPSPARAEIDVPARWRRWLALAAALTVMVLVMVFRDKVREFPQYGYLGVFIFSLLSNATIILPVPGLVSVLAAGSAFNPIVVGLVAGIAEPIGELTGYLAGYAGRAVIADHKTYARIMGWMRGHNYLSGYLTIFVLSLIPNPLFDLAGIAAGALKLPVSGFLVSCWLGKTLKAIGIAFLGGWAVPFIERLLS